ncbi:hypothetical protein H8K33_05465 [Undibacterium amnicola]|uniref:Lysis protein n=1 Tax=Undibacterium amnicola TaxID=1834038 RepID=A0ABR6XPX9_9BURK|nr:hypothetical protein [Undibacterium amnicola]MBC3830947.1 hypothetical protein [Undibacterium amnicola]
MSKLNELVTNVICVSVAVVLGYFAGEYHAGKAFEFEKIKLNNAATEKYNKLVADTNKAQSDSKERIKELETDAERVELNAKINIANMRSDVRNRVVRVFVPVSSCSANPISGDFTLVPDNGQARAELLPETVLDLIDIAADANKEVRRTNLCIDQYNEVKSMLDKLRNNKVE